MLHLYTFDFKDLSSGYSFTEKHSGTTTRCKGPQLCLILPQFAINTEQIRFIKGYT